MRRVLLRGLTISSVLFTGLVLGATVFREPLVQAAQPILGVFVTNDASTAIPVRQLGPVSALPAVPSAPWFASEVLDHDGPSDAFLAGPSNAIHLTSLTFSSQSDFVGQPPPPGSLFLQAYYVASTATSCVSGQSGPILWRIVGTPTPLAVTFPTPLTVIAPTGQKVCLHAFPSFGSATVNVNASGFLGS